MTSASMFAAVAFVLAAAAVSADDSNAAPTAWVWRTGTPATIAAQVKQGYRIVDLELYSASPYRLTALLVRNSGAYKQTWWWFYNLELAELGAKLTELKARIVDLEAYVLNGKLRFAVVLTPNTGSNAKSWWYYVGVTPAFIAQKLKDNRARLVDINPYKVGSATRYSAVMIKNSGSDLRSWAWFHNVSPSFISSKLSSLNMRLMDIEHNGGGKFTVIMERSAFGWFWYRGLSSAAMLEKASMNDARLFHVTPYVSGGKKVWAGIMIKNA